MNDTAADAAPDCAPPQPPTRTPRTRLPAGTCDAHFHVFGDRVFCVDNPAELYGF